MSVRGEVGRMGGLKRGADDADAVVVGVPNFGVGKGLVSALMRSKTLKSWAK
jgi:hypothetical protein